MQLTLETIYEALRDSVRYYPKQRLKCQQPQTWRVLQQSLAAEVSGTPSSFGATICDKDKPYFWSRLWVESKYNPNNIMGEFPLLYAYEEPGVRIDPFGSGGTKYIVNLQIGVLDILSDDKEARKCVGCNARTINEIYRDTQTMLEACVNYLRGVHAYTIDGNRQGFFNKKMVEQALAAGSIQTAEWVGGVHSIADAALSVNKEAPYFRAERQTENLYGTAITLRFIVDGCCETDWNFTEPDFGVLAHEAGCNDC